MNKDRAKQLAELLLEYASHPDAYFEHNCGTAEQDWYKSYNVPTIESELNNYRVVIPKEPITAYAVVNKEDREVLRLCLGKSYAYLDCKERIDCHVVKLQEVEE